MWPAFLLAVGIGPMIYCLARAIGDLRDRRFVWAGLGILSAAMLLFFFFPLPFFAKG